MNDRKILENLVKRADQFCGTPIVQDDFPIYRDAFDGAVNSARLHLQRGRPKIVCLCGSTRFKDAWYEQTKRLTHDGYIVLGVGDLDTSVANRAVNVPICPDLKLRLDELHKRKIDMADSIFVLNVGGYIGQSTRSEIDYAIANGVAVEYLEEPKASVTT